MKNGSWKSSVRVASRSLLVAAVVFQGSCGGEWSPSDETASAPSEGVETVQSALADGDGLMVPAFMSPTVFEQFMSAYNVVSGAAPIVKGLIDFVSGAPSVADQIAAVQSRLIQQLRDNQQQTLAGGVEADFQMYMFIARNPCNAISLTNFSGLFLDTNRDFSTLRQVMDGSDLQQAYNLAENFNVVGQLLLTLLKGSPQIGSPSCGGTLAGGIQPFDSASFADILRKIKDMNYKLVGAQAEYNLPHYATPSLTGFRQSRLYASTMFAQNTNIALTCSGPGQAIIRCNPSTWKCFVVSGIGRSWPDQAACLAGTATRVDNAFNGDPTINALRAFQEKVISEFPNPVLSPLGSVPVVPIPSFREAPVVMVPNAPSGVDVFYRSDTSQLIHVSVPNGSPFSLTQAALMSGIAGTPAAQVTQTSLEVYAKKTDQTACQKTGPRVTAQTTSSAWSGCSFPLGSAKISDNPATTPLPAETGEGRNFFANSEGGRVGLAVTTTAAPSAPAWPASQFSFTNEIARTTPVAISMTSRLPLTWLFWIGIDGTLQLSTWQTVVAGGSIAGKQDASKIIGAPTVVSWGDDRWDMFAVGRDKAVWHKAWSNMTGLQAYQPLGGIVTAKPAAVAAFGPGRLDVFAVGATNHLHQAFCSGPSCDGGGGFFGWFDLGTTPNGITGNPVVVSPSNNKIDIVVQDAGGKLYHKSWNGIAWWPSDTTFQELSTVKAALN
jgi:hypothetical protein